MRVKISTWQANELREVRTVAGPNDPQAPCAWVALIADMLESGGPGDRVQVGRWHVLELVAA